MLIILISLFISLFTVFTGFEKNNKYKIMNNQGQQIHFAAEGNALMI